MSDTFWLHRDPSAYRGSHQYILQKDLPDNPYEGFTVPIESARLYLNRGDMEHILSGEPRCISAYSLTNYLRGSLRTDVYLAMLQASGSGGFSLPFNPNTGENEETILWEVLAGTKYAEEIMLEDLWDSQTVLDSSFDMEDMAETRNELARTLTVSRKDVTFVGCTYSTTALGSISIPLGKDPINVPSQTKYYFSEGSELYSVEKAVIERAIINHGIRQTKREADKQLRKKDREALDKQASDARYLINSIAHTVATGGDFVPMVKYYAKRFPGLSYKTVLLAFLKHPLTKWALGEIRDFDDPNGCIMHSRVTATKSTELPAWGHHEYKMEIPYVGEFRLLTAFKYLFKNGDTTAPFKERKPRRKTL